MVTDPTRNDVWQGLLDIARLVRYYEALSDRHRRNYFTIRLLLLIAATGGVAALLELLPDGIQILAGALVAVLVALDFVTDYAKKAAVLHAISIECSALEIEWEDLWGNLENLGDTEARQNHAGLSRRLANITGAAGHADIREDRKLNEQCEAAAYRVIQNQYGV